MKITKVVVVGGGAGGLELVTKLGRKLGRKKHAVITLVDLSLTHIWKPLWHEVAAGTLVAHEVELNYIAHAYRNYFNFEYGKLFGINRSKKILYLASIQDEKGNEIIPKRTLEYDILILSIGSVSNTFDLPGVQQHCIFLDSKYEIKKFRKWFLRKLLCARYYVYEARFSQFTIVVVGGGATGIELATELHYAIQQAARYSRITLNKHAINVSIVESADRILPMLPVETSKSALRKLQRLNIRVYTSQRVAEVSANGLLTKSGLFIAADFKIWAAGIKAPEVTHHLDGLEVNEVNQLVVRQTLQTTHDANIFAFGDCASCPQGINDKKVPPRAQAAHQQALFLYKSLKNYLYKNILLEYHYRDYGSLISLSRQYTLGNLAVGLKRNIFIQGWLARRVYLFLFRRHQAVLYGVWRVLMIILADALIRKIRPRLKLH